MKALVAGIGVLLALTAPAVTDTLFAPMNFMSLPQLQSWTGDFDGMRERRAVRILVPFSKTLFFIDRGQQLGVEAELGRQFDGWLNAKNKSRTQRVNVWMVPVARDELLKALNDGRGDIAAGNLTITPERLAEVDFADPWRSKIDEIVVTGPTASPVRSLEDLAGREVFVRTSSSFAEHLRALNETFANKGLEPIKFRPADGNLEDEDILEMVNAGLFPIAIVDDYTATLWSSVFSSLAPHSDLVVNTNGSMAWAIRKNNPLLKSELAEFIHQHPLISAFGGDMKSRFTADGRIVRNAYSDTDAKRFEELVEIFKAQGEAYQFDWRMLMAQGYQESGLDQSRKGLGGAVGIMQVMPTTAASKLFGFTGIDKDVNKNVQAGAAILRYIVDVCIGDDPAVDERNRMLLAFAGYNAGSGNLIKFRRIAKVQGLNPNVWFHNVEIAAAQVVGIRTVQYVDNIYKYFIAYSLYAERAAASRAARGQGPGADANIGAGTVGGQEKP